MESTSSHSRVRIRDLVLASGSRNIAQDDFDTMAKQFPVYDALYGYCRARLAGTES
jgi:hypothetical protein